MNALAGRPHNKHVRLAFADWYRALYVGLESISNNFSNFVTSSSIDIW
jgi:hypothetical protein